ncbi:nuclear transport factor 2 family protein [Roseivirga misakiensis]|nr:nuclear transport factor 2 family protein [Roseivirga misakiensis]
MKNSNNKQVLASYFEAFGRGDMVAVRSHFHPNCKIVSVREASRVNGQLHGSYQGLEEAETFLGNIVSLFDTQSFEVKSLMEAEENVVYAHGSFVHKVKAKGNMFESDWVQRCVIADGKILEYRFYEDSAAYEIAAH